MSMLKSNPKEFTMLGDWMNCFDMIKDGIGTEAAYSLFEAIADYSLSDIPTDFSSFKGEMTRLVLQSTFEAMRLSIDLNREKSPQKPEAPDGLQ